MNKEENVLLLMFISKSNKINLLDNFLNLYTYSIILFFYSNIIIFYTVIPSKLHRGVFYNYLSQHLKV